LVTQQNVVHNTQPFIIKDKRSIVLDAISNDYTKLFELHLPSTDQDKRDIIKKNLNQFCEIAVSSGSLEILILFDKYHGSITTDAYILQHAVECGHLKIIKWYRESNSIPYEWVCSCAAAYGQFEILKYLHENGYPWHVWTFAYSARYHHLEMLQYLHENECPKDRHAYTFAMYDGTNHETVIRLYKNDCT